MSKSILGGDKFYKIEWNELENNWSGMGRHTLSWRLDIFPET